MKLAWKQLAAAGRGRRRRRGADGADGADQRRRRDVPVSDLLEVVLRVQQAAPERADQLPVDRLRRRHPAAHERTVFFGATDGPMTQEQLLAAPGKILHFPTVLGAVVPSTTSRVSAAELKFTGPLLADIFLGKITKWNDPAIAKLNAGVNLPAPTSPSCTAPTARARPTSSSTTSSRSRRSGRSKVGVARSVNWPVGVGGKGNEGVAGLVKQTPGALGYVELIYALQNKISLRRGAERGRQVRQGRRPSR